MAAERLLLGFSVYKLGGFKEGHRQSGGRLVQRSEEQRKADTYLHKLRSINFPLYPLQVAQGITDPCYS